LQIYITDNCSGQSVNQQFTSFHDHSISMIKLYSALFNMTQNGL